MFIEKKGITTKEIIEGMNMVKERQYCTIELEELNSEIAELEEVRNLLKEDNKSALDYLAETQGMVYSTLKQKDTIDKAIEFLEANLKRK